MTVNYKRALLCVAVMLMSTGGLIMIFADTVWAVGAAVIGLGICLSLLARKGDRQQQVSVTSARKKIFVIFVAVFVVSCILWPFLLHWYDPKLDFGRLVVIFAVLLPLEIGYLYWYVFKRLKVKQPD